MMGGRGGAPNASALGKARANAAAAAAPAAPAATLETQIEQAIKRLETRPGGLVSLNSLRNSLSEVDRDTLDKELKRLDRARSIHLDPDPNTKATPQVAKDAAIRIGGEMKHFVSRVQ